MKRIIGTGWGDTIGAKAVIYAESTYTASTLGSNLTGMLWFTGPRTKIRTYTCHAEQWPTPQVSTDYTSMKGDLSISTGLHLHEGRSVDIDRFTPEDQSISGWHLQEGRPVDIDRFTPPWRKTGRYQVYTSMKGDPSISTGLHLHEWRPVDIDRFLPPWRESSIDRSPTQPTCASEKQTKANKRCALSLSLTLRLREHEVFVFVSYICMTKIKFQQLEHQI